MKFSANLGFLWTDRPLIDAVFAAKKAGFHAVECHWPYDTDPYALKKALQETQLPMLGLNTSRGDTKAGENGLSALLDKKNHARAAIDQAVQYAAIINCKNIHVMAGYAKGDESENCFIDNLSYACEQAAQHDQQILIEPLNPYDAPGYFLDDVYLAERLIKQLGYPQLKLMFDCYHIQILHGDVTRQLQRLIDIIGHIQFASVPNRAEPYAGELNYHHIFSAIQALGYTGPIGAEYKPSTGDTDASLEWKKPFE